MEFNQFSTVIGINFIPMVFYIVCFYFTLTFFQHLNTGDKRLQKKSKLFAVIALAIGLLTPVVINYFIFFKMSNF